MKSRFAVSGIYVIVHVESGKRYIGSSTNCRVRLNGHFSQLKRNLHGNPYLQNTFNKHGRSAFEMAILEETTDLLVKEDQWMSKYGGLDRSKLFNIKTAEHHQHSEETKIKIGDGNRGRKHSDEARLNMSRAHIGHTYIPSEYQRQAISKALKISEKAKAFHIRKCKPVVGIKNGAYEWFSSTKAAAEKYKVQPHQISEVLHGRRKTCRGLGWKFVSELSEKTNPR